VVSTQMGTGTGGHLQSRTISSDHTQSVPAMCIDQRLRQTEQARVRHFPPEIASILSR